MASLPYPLNRLVHSCCQCVCHHSIGLCTHVCVGMAGMPYPPTDTHSSVFPKQPVLLSFQKTTCSHVLLSFPKTCSHVLLSFPKQPVLLFSCLSQKHVLMFFCLSIKTCSHVLLSFSKQPVLLSFPQTTMFSLPPCLYVAKKKRLGATLPAVKP